MIDSSQQQLSLFDTQTKPSQAKPSPHLASIQPSGVDHQWAQVMNRLGFLWMYKEVELPPEGIEEINAPKGISYFWIPKAETALYCTAKPATLGEIGLARWVTRHKGIRVYIVSGSPRVRGYKVIIQAQVGPTELIRPLWAELALANLFGVPFGRLAEVF